MLEAMHRGPDGRRPLWDRIGELVSNRHSWLLALIVAVIGGGLMGAIGQSASAEQSPVSLPPSAESAKVAALLKEFPGGESAPVILVVTRTDGGALTPADLAAAEAARGRMVAATGAGGPPIPVAASDDGKAALAPVPVATTLSGFALNDEVKALRQAAKAGLPADLAVNVTGGPAFGADIANAFAGANITLLAVTGAVVALLLIVTYRSPVLWLVPLLVIAFADRVAAVLGSAIADATGLAADGSTSGITSVLVFGAGTNYALLLISRYREELRHATATSPSAAHRGPIRRPGDRRQQCHRGAGPADAAVRVVAQHPQPRGASRVGSAGRRRVRAADAATPAWPCSARSCSGPSSLVPEPRKSPTPEPGIGSRTGCPTTPAGSPSWRPRYWPCWPPACWQPRWGSTRSTSSG